MKVIHMLWFVLLYIGEIVLSTIRLAVLVLSPRPHFDPGFVEIPLDVKGEFPRFLFACLISMTPGTMSVALDNTNNILTVHVLNMPDPDASVRQMKASFELPLIRIFGRV